MGRNVAAGMTGGLAYILDEDDSFIPKVSLMPILFPHAVLLTLYSLLLFKIYLIHKKCIHLVDKNCSVAHILLDAGLH